MTLPFLMFRGTGRAIDLSVKKNYEAGVKMLEHMDFEAYDKEIRKTYKPR